VTTANEKGWLPDGEWKFIQDSVPIACVDVLPIRRRPAQSPEVGLIYRETPHQGRRWCLIGGRMLRNESFRTAAIREVRHALGAEVDCKLDDPLQPLFVAEYFSLLREGCLFDPRQHSVGLTFSAQLQGNIKPRGEALEFRWFSARQLSDGGGFGFGHETVAAECIRRLGFCE
jgi:ADP-ribose pyrophosphatase YjhB (NUDIX family)